MTFSLLYLLFGQTPTKMAFPQRSANINYEVGGTAVKGSS